MCHSQIVIITAASTILFAHSRNKHILKWCVCFNKANKKAEMSHSHTNNAFKPCNKVSIQYVYNNSQRQAHGNKPTNFFLRPTNDIAFPLT
mmetsp:Transcript_44375/g.53641  ORF Transcript_44375/g.53641 Transcript_44375/m.53641 type:complete len:91 (-) Transcript_44375:17-289(-)